MLNQVILVGRLVRTPELQLSESGKKKSLVTLAVNRGFKNQNGEYDTDFLDCTLWTSVAENTAEYCKTGDVIGVKGRLQTRLIESDEGIKYKKVEVIAEKVTFLSSARNNKDKDENSEDDGVTVDVIDTSDIDTSDNEEGTTIDGEQVVGKKTGRKKK